MFKAELSSESNRGREWIEFALKVLTHIDSYTVPQYKDFPHDKVTTDTTDDIKVSLDRYVKRMGRNQRGNDDQLLDCKKIAHYACMVYNKFEEKFTNNEEDNIFEFELADGGKINPDDYDNYILKMTQFLSKHKKVRVTFHGE